ncbi:hypothetical protein ACS0TY_003418 [Phlomoides rotata]
MNFVSSEWNKAPLHLGKGFSLYTCHVYQGKVKIKMITNFWVFDVEIFLEPILQIEPVRMVSLHSNQK